MSVSIEKLEELIAERQKAIRGHEAHIASLQDAIEHSKGEIRGLELALKLCQDDKAGSPNGSPTLIGKYAGMGLTDAILDAVQTRGIAPGMTARELVDVLEAEGFKTQAKDFYNSVYPIAMGLVEQDRIKEGKKEGKRTFMRKI